VSLRFRSKSSIRSTRQTYALPRTESSCLLELGLQLGTSLLGLVKMEAAVVLRRKIRSDVSRNVLVSSLRIVAICFCRAEPETQFDAHAIKTVATIHGFCSCR